MLSKDLITETQRRLTELEYYRLRIDGVDGPGTQNAVIRFKEANGLRARAFIGPKTFALLTSPKAVRFSRPQMPEGVPPWMVEAAALLGTREVKGAGSNPVIMGWADSLDQWYSGDDVAWCGLFTAHCLSVGAPDEPQHFNRLGARKWLEYGEDALGGADPKAADLPFGGVAVLWRTHPTRSWKGHVGPAITAQNDTHFAMIGGNQSDNVTEAWFPRSRLLGVRCPVGWETRLQSAPRRATGTVSTREA